MTRNPVSAQGGNRRSATADFLLSAASLILLTGSLLVAGTVLLSRSTDGAFFARCSVRHVLIATGLFFLIIAGYAGLFSRGFRGLIRRKFCVVPGWLAPLMVLVPVPLFGLFWFLFPYPLLDRWSGFAGVSLLLTSPGLMAYGSFPPEKLRDSLKGLLVTLPVLVVGAFLLEAVTRAVVPGSIFNPRLGLVPDRLFILEIDLPGISPEGVMTTNRWGMRGEQPPEDWGDYRTMIAVGGSTTVCYYLDDEKTWPHILQENLRREGVRAWVGNAGIPCHSLSEHILFVEEVIADIRPDYVLFLVGANELAHFWGGEAAVNRSPLQARGIRDRLFGMSRVLQVLHKARIVLMDDAMVVTPNVSDERERVRHRLQAPMTLAEPRLPENLLDLLPEPDAFARDLTVIIQLCRELGTTPVFLTQPFLFDDTPQWRGIHGAVLHGSADSAYSAASLWLFVDALNRELMEVCIREGVLYFDLASVASHSRDYFYDEMHFTEAGAGLVGESVAEFLLSTGLMDGDD